MVVTVDLKHVDDLKDGTFRFRRRYPKAVQSVLGKAPMQERMKAREGEALVREQAAMLAEFDRRVADAREHLLALSGESPRAKRSRALAEARKLVAEVVGPYDESEKRALLAEELHRVGADVALVQAVADPHGKAPAVTLLDAKNDYLKLNVGGDKKGQLLVGRVAKFWGPLDKIVLSEMKREKARALLDSMLADTKDDGKTLSLSTVKRELRCLSAIISVGLEEHNL